MPIVQQLSPGIAILGEDFPQNVYQAESVNYGFNSIKMPVDGNNVETFPSGSEMLFDNNTENRDENAGQWVLHDNEYDEMETDPDILHACDGCDRAFVNVAKLNDHRSSCSKINHASVKSVFLQYKSPVKSPFIKPSPIFKTKLIVNAPPSNVGKERKRQVARRTIQKSRQKLHFLPTVPETPPPPTNQGEFLQCLGLITSKKETNESSTCDVKKPVYFNNVPKKYVPNVPTIHLPPHQRISTRRADDFENKWVMIDKSCPAYPTNHPKYVNFLDVKSPEMYESTRSLQYNVKILEKIESKINRIEKRVVKQRSLRKIADEKLNFQDLPSNRIDDWIDILQRTETAEARLIDIKNRFNPVELLCGLKEANVKVDKITNDADFSEHRNKAVNLLAKCMKTIEYLFNRLKMVEKKKVFLPKFLLLKLSEEDILQAKSGINLKEIREKYNIRTYYKSPPKKNNIYNKNIAKMKTAVKKKIKRLTSKKSVNKISTHRKPVNKKVVTKPKQLPAHQAQCNLPLRSAQNQVTARQVPLPECRVQLNKIRSVDDDDIQEIYCSIRKPSTFVKPVNTKKRKIIPSQIKSQANNKNTVPNKIHLPKFENTKRARVETVAQFSVGANIKASEQNVKKSVEDDDDIKEVYCHIVRPCSVLLQPIKSEKTASPTNSIKSVVSGTGGVKSKFIPVNNNAATTSTAKPAAINKTSPKKLSNNVTTKLIPHLPEITIGYRNTLEGTSGPGPSGNVTMPVSLTCDKSCEGKK